MLTFLKKFRYFAMGAVVLQFGGCGDFLSNVLQDSITFTALEFITDNPLGPLGLDLFAD